jgi:glycosyltransferase involved in cell wall biosynthesis
MGFFMSEKLPAVTACILALNESLLIEECLLHLRPHVDFLLVLDGLSSDDTAEKAGKIADGVFEHKFSGSIATERNYIQNLAPSDWVLHCDADERFNEVFLRNIRQIIFDSKVKCFRFKRNNLDRDYPLHDADDAQVRLLDKRVSVWSRNVHEVLWSLEFNKPLDQCGDAFVKYVPEYPITHLRRLKGDRERILMRWKQISTQESK